MSLKATSMFNRHKCSDSEDKAYAMLDTYREATLAKETKV